MKIEPFVVKSVNDIKTAIQPFFKNSQKTRTDIKTDVEWEDRESDKKTPRKYKTSVSAYVDDVDIKDVVLEAFDVLAHQQKMLDDIADALEEDEYAPTLPRANIKDVRSPIDAFIKHRMGGVRDGLTIVWYLNNKKWVFNPLNNELKEE
jgi:hypothetical protein